MKTRKPDKTASDEALVGQIIGFAREYHAKDFPNLSRENCPPKDALLGTIETGALPDENLRRHLLSCSPCFQDFQALRNESLSSLPVTETQGNQKKWAWMKFFRQPQAAVAALILLIGILTGALFFGWRKQSVTSDFAGQMPTQTVNQDGHKNRANSENVSPSNEADRPSATAELPKPALKNSAAEPTTESNKAKIPSPKTDAPEYLAKNIINLDLSKAAVTRDAGGLETIHPLRAETVNLNVKLPADSPSGVYEISLLDEFGKPLAKSETRTSSGKNLQIKLDLRNQSGRARLCIAPRGEIPDCLAVKIGGAP